MNNRFCALALSAGIAMASIVLAPPAAQAAPPAPEPEPYAEFDYLAVVEAKDGGGQETAEVRIIFRYDLDLVPGSGPFGSADGIDSYAPLSRFILEVGDECISMSGAGTSVTLVNDGGSMFVQDNFLFSAEPPAPDGEQLLGMQLVSAFFVIYDDQATMIDDTSLPTSPDPFVNENQQASIELVRPDGSRALLHSVFDHVVGMGRFDPAGAVEGIEENIAFYVQDRNLNRTLLSTVERARGYVADASLANDSKAEETLETFIKQVQAAQRAKKITQETADILVNNAEGVKLYLPSCL